ncbi:MAG TPA: hypothetical protein VJR89_36965 [Polyangiales bacterium]|nr:hypothetical protein [Polyangiales bacterium]
MLELKTLRLRVLMVAGLAASAWLVAAPSARADIAIAGDLDVLVPLDIDDVTSGPGFGLRLGYQLHLPLIVLVPEIGYNWGSFGDGATINRGVVGARLGIGEIFRFGVSAHLGYGHRSEDIQTVHYTHDGLTLDGGLFFDLTVLPLLDIGVHAYYGRMAGDEEKGMEVLQWMNFGAHAVLVI